MDFLKKFLKKKVSIQDVLSSLEKFSNDTKSLNEISSLASSFFGPNWKFNLEMYISTMPEKEKKKYLPLIRNILTFDRAVSLWIMAQQVLKGAKPLTSDVMKNIEEYEEYLPKFGVEGVRLLEKLKEKFNLSDDTIVLEKKVEVEKKDVIRDEEIKEEEIKDTPKSEKILKKVSNKELEEGVFVNRSKKDEVATPVIEEKVEVEEVAPVKNVSEGDVSWELLNFFKVYNFVSQIREVMSAISLFKKAPSLEEYPYYGFIIDVIDYLIVQGDKILSTESDENIRKCFDGGKSQLEDIVSFYKKQIKEEIVISEPVENKEIIEKEYEIKEN
ncbi:hypothetical protein HDR59_02570 [bacterium]|nr:hypothetical protein [bacterium]